MRQEGKTIHPGDHNPMKSVPTTSMNRQNSTPTHPPSLLKGVIAGLIGGLVATAAKSAAERIYPPRIHGEPAPPTLLAEKVAGHSLRLSTKTTAGETIHWGFGAAVGAAYGAVAEFYPEAANKGGVSFGMTLCAVTHEGLLPAMGLAAPPAEQEGREHRSEIATHIVYGVVAETVRNLVRRVL